MKTKKPPLRMATRDAHDGPGQAVCSSCHRLPRFCDCGPGAAPNCPICRKAQAVGKHFPDVELCDGMPMPKWMADRKAAEAAKIPVIPA